MRTTTMLGRMLMATSASLIAIAAPECAAQDQPEQTFSIRESSLDSALQAVGRQSGREIMYPADLVAGKSAQPLSGRMTADQAIRILIRGSGLDAEFREDVVLIRGRLAAPDAGTDPAVGPDILVTGTRIRGSSIVRSREISRSSALAQGFTDLGSLARSLPENFTGGQNPGVVSSDQKDSENLNGSTALNLRGLGPDATLTLINGHRVAYDGALQGVDVSAIPLIAIDRIDILPDGSSALYGSDAVAGVANVILRPDYDGLLTTLRLAVPTRGGGFQQQAGILTGRRWATGGLMAAIDYTHSSEVAADQRSFTRTLNASATIIPRQEQVSAVAAFHQSLGDKTEFKLDLSANRRSILVAIPYSSTKDARTYGNVTPRSSKSYSVSPSLLTDVGRWQINLAATHGVSTSTAHVSVFFDGAENIRTKVVYRNSLDTAEIGAEGPVFSLPAGDARLALGGGWRHVGLVGHIAGQIFGNEQTTLDIDAARDIFFGYGEVSLPLVSAANAMAGVEALQINGAARFEHYRDIGDVTTPKVALRYDPVAGVSFRASWGRSFKAPTLYLANQPTYGSLLNQDYYDPYPPTTLPVLVLAGGGRALGPERARTWTAGVAVSPWHDRDVSLEATFYNLRYRDRVLAPLVQDTNIFANPAAADLISFPTPVEIATLVASLPNGVTNQTDTPFDPASVYAVIDERLQNIASQQVKGVDVVLHASTPVGPEDKLTLDASASYLTSSQIRGPGQLEIQRAGTIFDPPHWRGRGSAVWEHGAIVAAAAVNFIGGTRDIRFTEDTFVRSFTSFDLAITARPSTARGALAGTELSLAVSNLFNRAPAIIRTTFDGSTPFDSTNYPSIGRVISVGLTKRW